MYDTPCECPLSAICETTKRLKCERHGIEKNQHWHMLCQTREDYFNAWEQGIGPGQPQTPRPRQLDGVVTSVRTKLKPG